MGPQVRAAIRYWVLFGMVTLALAWVAYLVTGLRADLDEANIARNALVDQVKDMGGTPVAGPAGKDGPVGPAGRDGRDGSDGADGTHGASGDRGAKGDTGATGAAGAKGDTGDKGDTGEAGPRGDTGEVGPKGETGAKGDTGPRGADGTTKCPSGYHFELKEVWSGKALVCVSDTAQP